MTCALMADKPGGCIAGAREEEERTWQPAHSEEERHQSAGSQSPAAAHLCCLPAPEPCSIVKATLESLLIQFTLKIPSLAS